MRQRSAIPVVPTRPQIARAASSKQRLNVTP
jgi:hypothetical protein